MEKLEIVESSTVPLKIEDVDTDQIIPARFLKATDRVGFGDNLFRDWRYTQDNEFKNDFPLNDDRYKGEILVAGKNFGCGSSREHAAWALFDYGFKVVISSFFADIFKGNCLNNGILPVQISDVDLELLFLSIEKNNKLKIKVDLPDQRLMVDELGLNIRFDINPYKKECLINGFDDMDYLLSLKEDILKYEETLKI